MIDWHGERAWPLGHYGLGNKVIDLSFLGWLEAALKEDGTDWMDE